MQILVKSMPIGFAWSLVTDDGSQYAGISLDLPTVVTRVQDLNAKVLELKPLRVQETA